MPEREGDFGAWEAELAAERVTRRKAKPYFSATTTNSYSDIAKGLSIRSVVGGASPFVR